MDGLVAAVNVVMPATMLFARYAGNTPIGKFTFQHLFMLYLFFSSPVAHPWHTHDAALTHMMKAYAKFTDLF